MTKPSVSPEHSRSRVADSRRRRRRRAAPRACQFLRRSVTQLRSLHESDVIWKRPRGVLAGSGHEDEQTIPPERAANVPVTCVDENAWAPVPPHQTSTRTGAPQLLQTRGPVSAAPLLLLCPQPCQLRPQRPLPAPFFSRSTVFLAPGVQGWDGGGSGMSKSRPLRWLWGQGQGSGYDFTSVTNEAGGEEFN